MIALAKILSDTVKYYDHYGYKNIKMALAISLGTLVAWYISSYLIFDILADISVHAGITCAQVSVIRGRRADDRLSSWVDLLIQAMLLSPGSIITPIPLQI